MECDCGSCGGCGCRGRVGGLGGGRCDGNTMEFDGSYVGRACEIQDGSMVALEALKCHKTSRSSGKHAHLSLQEAYERPP